MIGHRRHGSSPRLMALQSILSPNRRESLPTPSAGVRIIGPEWDRSHRGSSYSRLGAVGGNHDPGRTARAHGAGFSASWIASLIGGTTRNAKARPTTTRGKRLGACRASMFWGRVIPCLSLLMSCVRAAERREREMSECLHCDINQLVQQRLERGDTDLGEVASMLVESLADLILLAPENEQPNLMAYALSGFGQMFLEKSGAVEGGSSATH